LEREKKKRGVCKMTFTTVGGKKKSWGEKKLCHPLRNEKKDT